MSLITSSIPNLINGVSQQPPSLKLKTQSQLQENGISSVVKGLTKRPSTELMANLGDVVGADKAFIHDMRRDEDEYYTLIVTTNDMFVVDKDGVQRTVINDAPNYLANLTNPQEEIAATTIADYTFLLNKNTHATAELSYSPSREKEALVYVKQGDFTTRYKLHITKDGTTYTRAIETMASTQPDDATAKKSEQSIQTDRIATNLIFNVATDTEYYGSTGAMPIAGIQFTQHGNVLHIESTDGEDFKVEVEDSRGNQHIFAFKETAADFKKLPPSGPEGFVIAVIGSNAKGEDDYYVKLEVNDTGGQVWRETIKPNIKTKLAANGMPHKLVSNADGSFTFKQASYKSRDVGDDDTNPMPSFVGLTISDIFFHRNRLGLLADENVILSEAGRFDEFNFFKRTTLTILDTDPIDAAVSNNKVSILKHAVPFNESLLLFSDLTQFRLTAQDLLTPETIALDVTTQFEASLRSKPVGAGRYVFFATNRNKWSGVREYFVDSSTEVDDASDITAHIPEYLPGEIKKMEASSNEDVLLCLCADDPKAIYVYSYYWQGQEKLQSSWSRWTFEGEVLNMTFNKSNIDLLMRYESGNGHVVCLERMNLSSDEAVNHTTLSHGIHLDRRQIWTDPSQTLVADPFPIDGQPTLYVTSDGQSVSYAVASSLVSIGKPIFVGIPYRFRYVFNKQTLKSDNEILTGRLQLRNMTLMFSDTGFFEVLVTPTNRETRINTFQTNTIDVQTHDAVGKLTGRYKFPVLSKAEEVEIEIISNSHFPASFQSAEWEGYFVTRAQRI